MTLEKLCALIAQPGADCGRTRSDHFLPPGETFHLGVLSYQIEGLPEKEVDAVTESTIIELLCRRDPGALAALQTEYTRYCTAIVGGILADRADVEEVVADVWMQVWSSIPPNDPVHLRLYVGRIARNLALNRLEYLGAGKRAAPPMEELAAVTPDRSLERQALKDALEAFLRQQKPLHRRIFLRRYWYGDSIEELSARFGCSRAKVTGILFRLRQKLRDHLEKEDIYVGTK